MKQTGRRDLLIFVACFAIFLLSLMAVYIEMGQHEDNIVQAYGEEQQTLAAQTANEAALILGETGGKTALESRVVTEVLAKNDVSSNRYYLFADSNGIIYLRNSSVTEKTRGLSVRQAFAHYRASSGNMTELFNALAAKSSRTVTFTFAADHSEQLISLYFFAKGGHSYLIGICASKDYVTSQYQILAHNLNMYLFCGLLCVLFFGMSVLYILQLMGSGRLVEVLHKDIRGKNVLIQYLTTTDAQGKYRDAQTGVYNRDFFLKLLTGSRQKKLLPVSIAVIRISIKDASRQEAAMKSVANALMGVASADCIAARTDENEFSILMLNTTEYKAGRRIRLLAAELELHYIRADCGIAVLKSIKQNPDEVYNKAHSMMFYQSLLDE